jgi:hypothetical protein
MSRPASKTFVPLRIANPKRCKGPVHALAAFAALLVTACVTLVPAYDQASVDRTTEISKSVLTFYQDLLATSAAERKAAVTGAMGKTQGEIETQIRLHLLREQGRNMNEDAITIATNLLESWQTFSTSHREGDATALSDATLNIERTTMERHLRSAFVAEEAKKLASTK